MKEMMEEVLREERVFHDVFGCSDCYVDPHNRHVSYCLLSVYNPFHPSHICLGGSRAGVECKGRGRGRERGEKQLLNTSWVLNFR